MSVTSVLAIDPGTFASGWAVMDYKTREPVACGKYENERLLDELTLGFFYADLVVVEMLTSYGAPVGRETLETCVWVGRFLQAAAMDGKQIQTMNRRDVKYELTGSTRATDAMIRQYLVDRFAYGVRNHGKGTQDFPGWFYGFRADIWQAYALGVAWIDRKERGGTA